MKIFSQLIVVIIFIGAIFVFKNDFDYKLVYSKVANYFQNEINKYSIDYKDQIGNLMNGFKEGMNPLNNIINNKSETPGALTVPDEYLTYNLKSINLSSKNVIDIINEYRTSNGSLVILKESPKLNISAEKKLQDMFTNQYFEHASPSGVDVGDLGDSVGYAYIVIGENLALGNFKNDRSLVDAWMASPGHKDNILNKRYTETGVAVGQGVYKDKSIWMAVQHFGLPKSACPSIDDALRSMIDNDQKRVKKLENDLAYKRSEIDSGGLQAKEGVDIIGKIENYNNLVSDYYNIFDNIKEKINKYNEQVKSFNDCIAEVN